MKEPTRKTALFILCACSLVFLVGCPPTASITADKTEIGPGESVTLSWSTSWGKRVTIDPGIGEVTLNGTRVVHPTETTTYTVTATNAEGSSTSSVTITVTQPAPTVSISATPTSIVLGQSATLSWTSENADSAIISPSVGPVDVNGSVQVTPTETTAYVITVTGPGGTRSAGVTLTVTVPLPEITFSATPGSVQRGHSSTLSWSTSNALCVSIDNGLGDMPLSGSVPVSPRETITYTLTATGQGATVYASTTITVLEPDPPPTVSFSASPDRVAEGGTVTLSWSSESATTAHIDNGVGKVPVNGSVVVLPQHTTTYRITVLGSTGSADAETTVKVIAEPQPPPDGSFGEDYTALVPEDATIDKYNPELFSIVTGRVEDIHGLPLEGVAVTVHAYPEYGSVATNADGQYWIPVNGGNTYTIVFKKAGYIPSSRHAATVANSFANTETVQLIAEDPQSTPIDFNGDVTSVSMHKSTPVSDEFGVRSSTMIFTGDNRAYAVDEQGNDIGQLPVINVRATEFAKPETMPAKLPPTSAYTFCAELSVDGVSRVRFAKPVVWWVDNFIGFDVGDAVPVGYFDRDRGMWVPAPDGIVVMLLDQDGDGIVDAMDATGDGVADDLDADGQFADEVAGIGDPTLCMS